MSKSKFILFFLIFTVVSMGAQVFLFQEQITKTLVTWAILSGIIATGILLITNRKTKEENS